MRVQSCSRPRRSRGAAARWKLLVKLGEAVGLSWREPLAIKPQRVRVGQRASTSGMHTHVVCSICRGEAELWRRKRFLGDALHNLLSLSQRTAKLRVESARVLVRWSPGLPAPTPMLKGRWSRPSSVLVSMQCWRAGRERGDPDEGWS